MYSTINLDKDISQIWLLYTSSYEYYHCQRQIKEFGKSEYADSRFLFFLTYSNWYILVIELCKIFQNDNRNQQFNVYGLINKLLNGHRNLDFKELFPLADVQKHYSNFNSLNIIDIRDKLIILRDKFYAHTDRLDENFLNEININLTEIESLFNLLRCFIFDIKSKVFGSHAMFEEEIFINIKDILNCVEEKNKRYHEEILRNFNEERNNL